MVTTENKQAWKRMGWMSRRWAGSDMGQAGLELMVQAGLELNYMQLVAGSDKAQADLELMVQAGLQLSYVQGMTLNF